MPDKFGDKVRLLHVLDSIINITKYIGEIEYEEFAKNSMLVDACIRQLGIIGEACNRISEEVKTNYDEVQWRQIIGLRNFVIHEYFGVDDKIIWDVITEHLPTLNTQTKEILADLNEEE